MDYSFLAVLLLCLGLALIAAEIFIPSGGLITLMSLTVLGLSLLCAWSAWWESSRGVFWIYIAVLVLGLPASLIAAINIFPRTTLGKRVLLDGPSLDEVTPYAREHAKLQALVGKHGKTLSMLNPGGLVQIESERVHCESEGMVIDPQEDVVVVGINGQRVVVRKSTAPPEEPPAEETLAEDDSTGKEQPPLDFEYPPS